MSTPSPTLLERLGLKIAASEEDLARQKERLERQAQEAQQLREQLRRRIDAVENAKARIEQAKRQLEERKQQIDEFNHWVLGYWGKDVSGGLDYTPLVALRTAIDDFPRVLTHLNRELQTAQKELFDFEKKHDI